MESPKWMKGSVVERKTRDGKTLKRTHIEVDANLAYSAFFAELEARRETIKKMVETVFNHLEEQRKAGVKAPTVEYETDELDSLVMKFDKTKLDQYWLEVAYQCIKMDCQRFNGIGIDIRFRDAKKKYAQKNYPKGKGAFAATQGKEARSHYKKLRGVLP